jgi:hypothetical protein
MKFAKDTLYFLAAVVCVPLVVFGVTGLLLCIALPGCMLHDRRKQKKLDLDEHDDGARHYRGLHTLGNDQCLVR